MILFSNVRVLTFLNKKIGIGFIMGDFNDGIGTYQNVKGDDNVMVLDLIYDS